MRQIIALMWKEAREQRWILLVAVAIFFGLPLIMATFSYYRVRDGGRFYSEDGLGLVLAFGGLLAIFLALGATCRDLTNPLYDFWRSRPIGLVRLLLVKYAIALGALLAVTCGALILTIVMHCAAFGGRWYNSWGAKFLLYHTFTLATIYSISFLLGCLVRHTARAAVLSLLAGLLVYFLPAVLPPLGSLSVINRILGASTTGTTLIAWVMGNVVAAKYFFLSMLAGSCAAVILAILAVYRGWRLTVDKRFLCWTFVGVALVLWASAAFQLGNNLTGEKPISISPPGAVGWRDAAEVACDGERGAMLLYTKEGGPPDPDRRWISQKVRYSVCSFDLSGGDLKLGPEIPVGVGRRPNWYGSSLRRIVFSPVHPNRAYCLLYELTQVQEERRISRFALCTVGLDAGGQNKIVHELDLLGYLESDTVSHPQMHLFGRRIYVRTISGILVIDLRDGDSTEVSEVIALTTGIRFRRGGPGDRGFSIESLELLPLEGLSPRERLEVSLNLTSLGYPFAFEDDLLVVATVDHLTTYRLTELDQSTACFQKIARLHATPLELIVLNWPQRMILRDGLAYVLAGGLYVYDVRDPEQPKRAGHYASPSESLLAISLLPDGRVLAAGQKIHILDPPRDRLEKE